MGAMTDISHKINSCKLSLCHILDSLMNCIFEIKISHAGLNFGEVTKSFPAKYVYPNRN